jgi:hypothetical protein
MGKYKLVYNGMPIRLSAHGVKMRWATLVEYLRANRGEYLEFAGWRFEFGYGLLYLRERRFWGYYIPFSGVKDKNILDVGGGCGETAKFFFDNGASNVHVIENNPICADYLRYNSNMFSNLTYQIKNFEISDITEKYDLVKLDIEGYEILLLPHLDSLNVDIILESHSVYIADRFLEKGFKLLSGYRVDKEIYGDAPQLCRLKK